MRFITKNVFRHYPTWSFSILLRESCNVIRIWDLTPLLRFKGWSSFVLLTTKISCPNQLQRHAIYPTTNRLAFGEIIEAHGTFHASSLQLEGCLRRQHYQVMRPCLSLLLLTRLTYAEEEGCARGNGMHGQLPCFSKSHVLSMLPYFMYAPFEVRGTGVKPELPSQRRDAAIAIG